MQRNHKYLCSTFNDCRVCSLRRWVDNIKMHLREIGWDGMDCIDLA
jgi:hypothetical protein